MNLCYLHYSLQAVCACILLWLGHIMELPSGPSGSVGRGVIELILITIILIIDFFVIGGYFYKSIFAFNSDKLESVIYTCALLIIFLAIIALLCFMLAKFESVVNIKIAISLIILALVVLPPTLVKVAALKMSH